MKEFMVPLKETQILIRFMTQLGYSDPLQTKVCRMFRHVPREPRDVFLTKIMLLDPHNQNDKVWATVEIRQILRWPEHLTDGYDHR